MKFIIIFTLTSKMAIVIFKTFQIIENNNDRLIMEFQ